jgi:type IV pilus assembly protein PilC
MAVFAWEGRSAQGASQKGSIEAANEAMALLLLRRQNIQPSVIKEKPKDILANIAFLQPKVKTKDLILFTRQLSTMIDAGLPLIQGVEILANQ